MHKKKKNKRKFGPEELKNKWEHETGFKHTLPCLCIAIRLAEV
jgi:hypothetical protein